MPNNTCIPFFDEADNITATATAAVVGMTCVDISGDLQADGTFSVATCAAGVRALGVAEYDAAVGQWVGVVREGIVPITADAFAIAAGAQVQVGANGTVKTWDGTLGSRVIGKCMTSAVASATAQIALYN